MLNKIAMITYVAAASLAVLVIDGTASVARADTVPQLADNIKHRFGETSGYTNGQLGTDWCFNVQTEPGYAYWYFDSGKGLVATKVRSTVRIQATYTDDADQKVKYSSVFLGLAITNEADEYKIPFGFESPSLAFLGDKKLSAEQMKLVTALASASASGTNDLKEPATTNCMPFTQFINGYPLPARLEPVSVSGAIKDNPSVYADARWWTFAGRPHAIRSVTSYEVKLILTKGGVDQEPVMARLIVGFGGGAGF